MERGVCANDQKRAYFSSIQYNSIYSRAPTNRGAARDRRHDAHGHTVREGPPAILSPPPQLALAAVCLVGLGRVEATSCGGLRLFRYRSRGLTAGYSFRYHPRAICFGTYDSVLVSQRLRGVTTGGIGDSFVLLPSSPGFCGVGCLLCALAFPPREAR